MQPTNKRKFWTTFTTLITLSLLAIGYFSFTASKSKTSPRVTIVIPFDHPFFTLSADIFTKEIEKKYPQGIFSTLNIEESDGGFDSVVATLKRSSPDLIVTLTTPTTKRINSKISDTPIVFLVVTDPLGNGLVSRLESNQKDLKSDGRMTLTGAGSPSSAKPHNLTGIASQVADESYFNFVRQIVPFETVGILYSPDSVVDNLEMNLYRFKQVKDFCASRGILTLGIKVNHPNEISEKVKSLASRVDAFYLGTDIALEQNIATYVSAVKEVEKPFFTSIPETAINTDFVLASVGIDYTKEAIRAADVAIRVLEGETPDQILVSLPPLENTNFYVNLDVAESLGVEITDSVKEKANFIYEKGTLTKR